MFNLREFVMSTLRGMAEREPEYKVRQFALGWYDKGELTSDDMTELDTLLNPPAVPDETAPDEIPAE